MAIISSRSQSIWDRYIYNMAIILLLCDGDPFKISCWRSLYKENIECHSLYCKELNFTRSLQSIQRLFLFFIFIIMIISMIAIYTLSTETTTIHSPVGWLSRVLQSTIIASSFDDARSQLLLLLLRWCLQWFFPSTYRSVEIFSQSSRPQIIRPARQNHCAAIKQVSANWNDTSNKIKPSFCRVLLI